MNIQIQSVKFDADVKLINFLESKIAKLERFDDTATNADVILKLDKDSENGNKVVLINLAVKGETLVAERRSTTFEEAADEVIDALKHQMEKRKK